jgi:C1A family cysteine protease
MPEKRQDPGDLARMVQERGMSWRPAETIVSHLDERQLQRRLGARLEQAQDLERRASLERHTRAAAAATRAAYPSAFDWRSVNGQNYITPVRDQLSCGSCVAFGTIAAVEGTYQVYRGQPDSGIDLSEAQLFYCIGPSTGAGCEVGWWPDDAFKGLASEGLVDEACFPYTPGDQPCNLCPDADSRKTSITGWHTITDVTEIKDWIANYGPVGACFVVYDDFPYYSGGIYEHVSTNAVGGHCVAIVGYDDSQQYWICKNSWSDAWGEGGYFRIRYGDSGIDAQVWAVDGIQDAGWFSNVQVQGAFAYAADNYAFVYCDQGLGWLQVDPTSTQQCLTMFNQLLACKMAGRPCDIQVDSGVITLVYAW